MGMRSRKKAIKRSTCPFGLRARRRRGSANRRKRRARRPTWFDNEEAREARDMLALPSYFRNSKRFNFSGFLIAVNAQDVVESVSDSK